MSDDLAALNSPSAEKGVTTPAPFQRIWEWMARHPIIVTLLLLALQTIPTLWNRDLKPVDELRHAAVFTELLEHGNWLALHLNGDFYPDKPAIYFWLLAAVGWIFGTHEPPIFFFVTAFSGGLLLVGTYFMGRRVAGGTREFGLLCGLVLVTAAFFIERTHYPRMDMLFCAFITFSLAAFYIALQKQRSTIWALAAFGFATLAVLTKGPFGLVVPLLTSIAFLAVTRRLDRLIALDMLLGALMSAAIFALYAFGIYLAEGWAYFNHMFGYVDDKSGWSFGIRFRILDYLYLLSSRWLPWTLLLFFLPWRKLGAAVRPSGWKEERNSGLLYLGLATVSALFALSTISYVNQNFLVMVLPPLAVLSAAVLYDMPANRLRWFVTTLAIVLLLVGIAMPIITEDNTDLFRISYGYVTGAMAVATSLLILAMRKGGLKPFMVIFPVCVSLIVLIHFNVTQTEHNRYKSTRPPSLGSR